MTALDRQYRKTSLGLGFALLLMFLLLQGCMTALAFANRLLAPYLVPDLLSGLYWGLYCLAYLFCFLMPIPFYRLILRKHVQQPVFYELRLPPMFLLLAVAALGIITAAGYLNSLLVLPFGVQGNADPLIALLEDGKPYMLVAVFLMIVIVPPICEELLFRGLVLGNLLPYGRGVAIFGSALLFAAMHQNLSQFLYAAVAGVLLGVLYEQSRSIWPCTLLHMLNNLWSYVQLLIILRVPDEAKAGWTLLGLNVILILAGAICALAVLFVRILRGTPRQGTLTVARPQHPVKGFFMPSVIVFLAISLGMAVFNLTQGA